MNRSEFVPLALLGEALSMALVYVLITLVYSLFGGGLFLRRRAPARA